MKSKLVGIALLALVLVACNTPPLPRYTATLGTYSVKEGNQDKVGVALLSSFDPDYPIPMKAFEIRILGPDGLRTTHVFPDPVNSKSDWFADPDLKASDGTYVVVASIDGREYRKSFLLDTDSYLDYPQGVTVQTSKNRIDVQWDEVEDSKVYLITLNQKVPGQTKPLLVQEGYTQDLEYAFDNLKLKPNQPYFVAVGALSIDPRTTHSQLTEPFNVSYGQTSQDIVSDAIGNLSILSSATHK